jgi:hypothetical protein
MERKLIIKNLENLEKNMEQKDPSGAWTIRQALRVIGTIERAEIDLILEIAEQKRRFVDSDFWMTPEENLRLNCLGLKEKADTLDTICLYMLEGQDINSINLKYERDKLERLKNRCKINKIPCANPTECKTCEVSKT